MASRFSPALQQLLVQAGMTEDLDEGVARLVRENVRKHTGKKVTKDLTWPGTPWNFPMIFAPTIYAMLDSGELKLIEIERPRFGGGTKKARFLAFA